MLTEEQLWDWVCANQNMVFYTVSGLPFSYHLKIGRDGQPNRELVIDRRQNSKTLNWGLIRKAYALALENQDKIFSRPKALGDIRGISYIFPMLWKLGVIHVTEPLENIMQSGKQE